MSRLTVLTDPRCRVCRRLRDHLAYTSTWVPLVLRDHVTAPASGAAGASAAAAHADLLVRGARGEVWSGENAWRMVLWAQRATRRLARTPDAARQAKAEHDARPAKLLLPAPAWEGGTRESGPRPRASCVGALAEIVRAVLGGLASLVMLLAVVLGLVALAYLLTKSAGVWGAGALLVGLVLWGWARAGRATIPPPRRLG